jgi:DNA mismatch repair protein MSH3
VHRLSVHAKRLVEAGHKVGVVRQIETAALKKAGDNRNAPFVRKLTNLYTKGTYIDETTGMEDEGGQKKKSSTGGYLLCFTESPRGGSGLDDRVAVGMVAVQPTTGDIIYDSFEDGFMRSELETRVLHISPCEFLVVGALSAATEKLIKHLSGSRTNVFGDRSRVERAEKGKTAASEAYSHVTTFYAERAGRSGDKGDAQALLDKVLALPEDVTVCLAAMMRHLREYGLEHIFELTRYFESFNTRTHMLVGGTTLESLEVYRNATDRSEHGSLFWALDKTATRSGRRLLRKWVGRPLLDAARIEERASAVEELVDGAGTPAVEKLVGVLTSTKEDLEKGLIRVYYGKATRAELVRTLQALQRIAAQYSTTAAAAAAETATAAEEATGFRSGLLSGAVLTLAPVVDVVVPYLNKINADAAQKDDKFAFFRDGEQTAAMAEHADAILGVERALDRHRREAAAALGKKTPVAYATVAGIEYLVEVDNTDVRRVPASWIKISGTKKVSRFHTPDVVALVAEREQHREALAAACDAAFRDLVAALAAEYQPLRDAVAALATLDCLLALAKVAAMPGFTRPRLLPEGSAATVRISEGRHPVADLLMDGGYIPFSAELAAPAPLAYVVTGPNMGGKSSFVRAVALLVVLAQIGSFVPAASLELTPADAIFVRMGARDNIMQGESTFMVELGETARVLAAATPRSLVVLDELGRGTSTHDGVAIAHAVLEHVVRDTRCLTLFITHYQDLARGAEGMGRVVKNVHMSFGGGQDEPGQDEGGEGEGGSDPKTLTFLYQVADGMAHRSYGLNVARLAAIPEDVIRVAAAKSAQLEAETRARMLKGAMAMVGRVLDGGLSVEEQEREVERLRASMESL